MLYFFLKKKIKIQSVPFAVGLDSLYVFLRNTRMPRYCLSKARRTGDLHFQGFFLFDLVFFVFHFFKKKKTKQNKNNFFRSTNQQMRNVRNMKDYDRDVSFVVDPQLACGFTYRSRLDIPTGTEIILTGVDIQNSIFLKKFNY